MGRIGIRGGVSEKGPTWGYFAHSKRTHKPEHPVSSCFGWFASTQTDLAKARSQYKFEYKQAFFCEHRNIIEKYWETTIIQDKPCPPPQKKPHNPDGNPASENSAFTFVLRRNSTWYTNVKFPEIIYFWGELFKNKKQGWVNNVSGSIGSTPPPTYYWTRDEQTRAFIRA